MASEPLVLNGDAARLAAELRALVPDSGSVSDAVAEILAGVRAGGDGAVREYTRRFDTGGAEPGPLIVADDELDAALDRLDPAIRQGLEREPSNSAIVSVDIDDAERKLERAGICEESPWAARPCTYRGVGHRTQAR